MFVAREEKVTYRPSPLIWGWYALELALVAGNPALWLTSLDVPLLASYT